MRSCEEPSLMSLWSLLQAATSKHWAPSKVHFILSLQAEDSRKCVHWLFHLLDQFTCFKKLNYCAWSTCFVGWMAPLWLSEYIYGPKSHQPTQEQVEAFNSGKEKRPCEMTPRPDANVGFWLVGVWFHRSWAMVGIVETLMETTG